MKRLAALWRMIFSGRFLARIKVFSQYLYYLALEKINPDLSLQRPKFAREKCNGAAEASDRTDSIELHLCADEGAKKEFGQNDVRRRKMVTHISDKFKTTSCFVCDALLTPVVQVIDADVPDDYVEVSWCSACDHLQYSVMPSRDWITRWYGSEWDTSGSLAQKLESRAITYRAYRRLLPYLGDRKLKVLDVGAGYGEKIFPFKEAGHEVHCTEATPRRADYLRQHVTDHVYFGTLDDPAVQQAVRKNGPFDLIFSYHVIEHIYNPRAELQILREISADDAIFYLAIPELYKEGILNNIYALEHIESFSRISAKTLLAQIGFRTVAAKDDLFQYYSNYCQYLIGRKSKVPVVVEKNADPGKIARYLNEALKLARISTLDGACFSYRYYPHAKLTYSVSEASKSKCRDVANHLPIRIYHRNLPLFWMYA